MEVESAAEGLDRREEREGAVRLAASSRKSCGACREMPRVGPREYEQSFLFPLLPFRSTRRIRLERRRSSAERPKSSASSPACFALFEFCRSPRANVPPREANQQYYEADITGSNKKLQNKARDHHRKRRSSPPSHRPPSSTRHQIHPHTRRRPSFHRRRRGGERGGDRGSNDDGGGGADDDGRSDKGGWGGGEDDGDGASGGTEW